MSGFRELNGHSIGIIVKEWCGGRSTKFARSGGRFVHRLSEYN